MNFLILCGEVMCLGKSPMISLGDLMRVLYGSPATQSSFYCNSIYNPCDNKMCDFLSHGLLSTGACWMFQDVVFAINDEGLVGWVEGNCFCFHFNGKCPSK